MDSNISNNYTYLETSTSFPFKWERPSNDLELNSGCVHIWKIELDHAIFQRNFHQDLSADEQLRAARIIIPEKRHSFQSARFALRKIISFYTHQEAVNIQFNYGPSGKPNLIRSFENRSIEFNISHSEDLMIATFAKNNPVGVDLEYIHPVIIKDWAVKQFFSKNDQVIYRNLLEDQKQIAFFSAWTKKEAFGKVVGTGFDSGRHLDHFEQGLRKCLPTGIYEMSQEDEFWYVRFSPQENYTAVAAIRSIEKQKLKFLMVHQEMFEN